MNIQNLIARFESLLQRHEKPLQKLVEQTATMREDIVKLKETIREHGEHLRSMAASLQKEPDPSQTQASGKMVVGTSSPSSVQTKK